MGDVVLILDATPRVHWKLIIVREVIMGKDG